MLCTPTKSKFQLSTCYGLYDFDVHTKTSPEHILGNKENI